MPDLQLLLAVFLGITVLLLLILTLRVQAFLSLLIASILTGLAAGLDAPQIISTVQTGMGSTLGFVATVVGLGAMFGAILEHSGGAQAIARSLLAGLGAERSPLAMTLAGFLVAIPVFFDVAFIILVPVVYALQRRSGRSLLRYAIPLLAGLAVTHAFIPPTPGPVAVADIVGADLGWVIGLGFVVGLPTALVSGLWFGKFIGEKIHVDAPPLTEGETETGKLPSFWLILSIIAVPIVLILLSTATASGLLPLGDGFLKNLVTLVGHPFTALIIANLLAWGLLGLARGFSKEKLFDITTKSMMPAGTIILLTGAGGVFKQTLVDTGAGEMLATAMTDWGLPVLVFAFLAAVLVRVLQGSATVAMITAAGLVAPLISEGQMTQPELALLVLAIAAGASILSHVNDSGFWLVSQYLGLSEKQTFRSWTVMTTILALTGFGMVMLLGAVM